MESDIATLQTEANKTRRIASLEILRMVLLVLDVTIAWFLFSGFIRNGKINEMLVVFGCAQWICDFSFQVAKTMCFCFA